MFLVFSKSQIQYLWQEEISVCKKLLPVSDKLIVQLIPIWT